MADDSVRRIELLGSGGIRLAADAVGDPADPPALLLHGGGQTRHSWHSTMHHLGGAGWYAISMDLRGHSDSEWDPNGTYTFDAFADDVIEVSRSLGRPALIGASLGGISALGALGFTRDDPAGRALVLVDVAPHIEETGTSRIRAFMNEHMTSGFATLEEVADAVQAYNPHRPRPHDLSGLRKNVRLRDDGRWYWHWDPRFITSRPHDDEARTLGTRTDTLIEAAKTLTVPTLLVRGRQSDLLSEAGAQEFLAMAPHARFVDVADAGHMVAGDKNDLFNDAVVSFLAEVHSA
ncbi:MAG: alpha/beta fold hydrolase [Actinobacteria bacterium]|nr:alpha/beta fold hydrolase [Actinomycetota bacterium]